MNRLSLLIGIVLIGGTSKAWSHPMDQYRMEMEVSPKRVVVKVMAALLRQEKTGVDSVGELDQIAADLIPSFPAVDMVVDGEDLAWKQGTPHPMTDVYGAWLEFQEVYTFEKEPRILKFSLDPSDKASFVVFVRYENGKTMTRLLSAEQPLEVLSTGDLNNGQSIRPPQFNTTNTSMDVPGGDYWRISRDYVKHGIWHILTGYDHMLFVAALVLAATSLWDLIKVVTAFTLAHTLTLTLSVLNILRLNERLVEPVIAASIVFVAVQNIVAPGASRGWMRFAAAFGFGLFHGLGFAGGLLDTMAGLGGLTIVSAIAAFSVGVELGHQFVVIPLYSLNVWARRFEGTQADRISQVLTRSGSILISVFGVYYWANAVFR